MSFNVIRFFGSVDWLILLVVVALVHAVILITANAFRRGMEEAERERVTSRINEGRA